MVGSGRLAPFNMYLVALLKSLLTVLLITATFFSGTNGTRHLSQRARIQMNQGVNPVLVGPANPPPTCVGTLGKPLLSDCREIVRSFSQVGGDAGFPPELRSRRSTLLREYYERGTSPRYQNQFRQLQVQLPIYKQVGECREFPQFYSPQSIHPFLYPVTICR